MTPKKPLNQWQEQNTPDTLPHHMRRNIAPGDGGCWLWTRSLSRDGYGWASLNQKTHQAHRIVFRLINGEIPEGKHLDHICRVRHCVNPDHLEIVTPAENLIRSPITTAGQERCLRCGGEFSWIGKAKPQRRCKACAREWKRKYAREHRAGLRRRAS